MEVGQKYKLYFNPRNQNNGNVEIRAIVDETQHPPSINRNSNPLLTWKMKRNRF